ncbi:MAG: hypothetical protein L0287_10070 [Anaerolineae bacterium]|nr:hypothetical protein [Anaerolineae bacterium]
MKTKTNPTNSNTVILVPLDKTIDNKYQAGEIDLTVVMKIKKSLIANRDNGRKGLEQLPLARLNPDGCYEFAFARHRRAAFIELAQEDPFWSEIPMIVQDLTDLQMFEALAIENLQRREINPMEKSEMYRTYMSFGKKSPEAALFFDTTEEDIRGTIRFGNLHPSAQELLRNGTINVSQGRMLLTVQRVVSQQRLVQALEDIKHKTFDIPTAIRNAVESDMDSERFDGSADAWLDLKKFPTKYLPPLSKKAVGELLNVQSGTVSEIALKKITLTDLMSDLESGIESADEQYSVFNPDQLEMMRILVNPPACTACSKHVQMDGVHYCGLKLCFNRKTLAWSAAETAKNVKEIGIPLYANEATDGKAIELNRYVEEDLKLFKSRHADLRLKQTKRVVWNNFSGLPNNLILVAVGKTAANRIKKQEAAASEKLISHEREIAEQEKRAREEEAKAITIQFLVRFHWDVASPALEPALGSVTNVSLMHSILKTMSNYDELFAESFPALPDDSENVAHLVQRALKMKRADGLRQLRRLIVHQLLYERQETRVLSTKKPVAEFANACQTIANEWGVKLLKGFTEQAKSYQAELDAALKELKSPKKVKA